MKVPIPLETNCPSIQHQPSPYRRQSGLYSPAVPAIPRENLHCAEVLQTSSTKTCAHRTFCLPSYYQKPEDSYCQLTAFLQLDSSQQLPTPTTKLNPALHHVSFINYLSHSYNWRNMWSPTLSLLSPGLVLCQLPLQTSKGSTVRIELKLFCSEKITTRHKPSS